MNIFLAYVFFSLIYTINCLGAAGTIATEYDLFPGVSALGVKVQMVAPNDDKPVVVGLNSTIVRYLTDGSIDLGFGTAGIAIFPGVRANGIAIFPTGSALADSIIVVGLESRVVRYTVNGQFDASVTFDVTNPGFYAPFPGICALGVAIQNLGANLDKAIVVGLNSTIVRYNTNGTIDTTFGVAGQNGIVTFPGIRANAVAIDSLDRIIVVGLEGQVIRYTPDGLIDTSITFDPLNLGFFAPFPGIAALAVDIDSSDRPIVVGLESQVIRYNATTGAIDTIYAPFPGIRAQGVAIDAFDRAIVVGLQSQVVRYSTGGIIDTIFFPFPGISAQAVTLNIATDEAIVVGKSSVVLGYNNT